MYKQNTHPHNLVILHYLHTRVWLQWWHSHTANGELCAHIYNHTIRASLYCTPVLEGLFWGVPLPLLYWVPLPLLYWVPLPWLYWVPLPVLDWELDVADAEVGLTMGTSAEVKVGLGLELVAARLHIGVCSVGPLPLAMWTRPLSNRWYKTLFTLVLSRDLPNLWHISRAESGCWGVPLIICKMESSKAVLAAAKAQKHTHTHTLYTIAVTEPHLA